MLGEKNSYICVRCMKCLNTPRILPLSTQLRLLSPFHLQSPCVCCFGLPGEWNRFVLSKVTWTERVSWWSWPKIIQDIIYTLYMYIIYLFMSQTPGFLFDPQNKSQVNFFLKMLGVCFSVYVVFFGGVNCWKACINSQQLGLVIFSSRVKQSSSNSIMGIW